MEHLVQHALNFAEINKSRARGAFNVHRELVVVELVLHVNDRGVEADILRGLVDGGEHLSLLRGLLSKRLEIGSAGATDNATLDGRGLSLREDDPLSLAGGHDSLHGANVLTAIALDDNNVAFGQTERGAINSDAALERDRDQTEWDRLLLLLPSGTMATESALVVVFCFFSEGEETMKDEEAEMVLLLLAEEEEEEPKKLGNWARTIL